MTVPDPAIRSGRRLAPHGALGLAAALAVALGAFPAAAQVALPGSWSQVATGTTGNLSGTLAKGSGTDRMLVVAVFVELGTGATTFAPTVSYGGQTVAKWVATDGTTANRQEVWLGFERQRDQRRHRGAADPHGQLRDRADPVVGVRGVLHRRAPEHAPQRELVHRSGRGRERHLAGVREGPGLRGERRGDLRRERQRHRQLHATGGDPGPHGALRRDAAEHRLRGHRALHFDGRHGGFEPAPKFPTPHRLLFLLRCHDRTAEPRALEMVTRTLTAMRLGGIWDHVGFGLHRYSTDGQWLLPHFEKMLYDQALTAMACLEASQVAQVQLLAQTADEIFTYVRRDMTSPEGAFFSAEDADSEGVEGKFYVWGLDEFRQVLGPAEAAFWEPIFNLKPEGNFQEEAGGHKTGANILHLTRPFDRWAAELGATDEQLWLRWEDARNRLFSVRADRIHPLKDDKILTDWNGLMIAALAMGARVRERRGYADAAEQAARFILDTLRGSDGRLFHRYREGERAIPGQAGDYAFFIFGLLHLHRSTFDVAWAEQAASGRPRRSPSGIP